MKVQGPKWFLGKKCPTIVCFILTELQLEQITRIKHKYDNSLRSDWATIEDVGNSRSSTTGSRPRSTLATVATGSESCRGPRMRHVATVPISIGDLPGQLDVCTLDIDK